MYLPADTPFSSGDNVGRDCRYARSTSVRETALPAECCHPEPPPGLDSGLLQDLSQKRTATSPVPPLVGERTRNVSIVRFPVTVDVAHMPVRAMNNQSITILKFHSRIRAIFPFSMGKNLPEVFKKCHQNGYILYYVFLFSPSQAL